MFHIGICDDHRGTCGELEEMLCAYGKRQGIRQDINVWYSGEELCGYLKAENHVLDVLFLDIELQTTDGIQVGRFIREKLDNLDTIIIYISAKSSYAMELFQAQPLDFLIKPLTEEKLQRVMEQVQRLTEKRKAIFEYFSNGFYFKVLLKDIQYFYSENKKVHMVLINGEKEFNGKLREVGKKFPVSFIQIHQSYLVNFDYIEQCSYDSVKMKNGETLSISQPYRKAVKEQLAQRMWIRRG